MNHIHKESKEFDCENLHHKRTKNKKTRHTRQPMSILPQQVPRAATATSFHTKQDDYDSTHDTTKIIEYKQYVRWGTAHQYL